MTDTGNMQRGHFPGTIHDSQPDDEIFVFYVDFACNAIIVQLCFDQVPVSHSEMITLIQYTPVLSDHQ
jgi:hypothetical protein